MTKKRRPLQHLQAHLPHQLPDSLLFNRPRYHAEVHATPHPLTTHPPLANPHAMSRHLLVSYLAPDLDFRRQQ